MGPREGLENENKNEPPCGSQLWEKEVLSASVRVRVAMGGGCDALLKQWWKCITKAMVRGVTVHVPSNRNPNVFKIMSCTVYLVNIRCYTLTVINVLPP